MCLLLLHLASKEILNFSSHFECSRINSLGRISCQDLRVITDFFEMAASSPSFSTTLSCWCSRQWGWN